MFVFTFSFDYPVNLVHKVSNYIKVSSFLNIYFTKKSLLFEITAIIAETL